MEKGALPRLGTVKSSGHFCALRRQVSWHPQNGSLPLSGGAGLLFDGAAGALPLEGLVVSAGSPCSVGKEASWHQQISKVCNLRLTCVCGSGLLALSSKLRVSVEKQSWQA
jgi:hypothetical protein